MPAAMARQGGQADPAVPAGRQGQRSARAVRVRGCGRQGVRLRAFQRPGKCKVVAPDAAKLGAECETPRRASSLLSCGSWARRAGT